MNDDSKWALVTLCCILSFFVLGWELGKNEGAKLAYPRGYCAALGSTAVADSLCVRGDSVIARVKL